MPTPAIDGAMVQFTDAPQIAATHSMGTALTAIKQHEFRSQGG